MLFRQLFEPESSTYTYLLACPDTGQAVLVDPVVETLERDLGALRQLGLRLAFSLDTHIHADHITSGDRAPGESALRADDARAGIRGGSLHGTDGGQAGYAVPSTAVRPGPLRPRHDVLAAL